MQKSKSFLVVMAFSVLLGTLEQGALMAQLLDQPVTIQLDFLDSIKENADWLRKELVARGLSDRYDIADGSLTTSDREVVRYVNRIHSFVHLDAPSLQLPYFDLHLRDSNAGLFRCETIFPRSIVPELDVMDFRKTEFPAENADTTMLNKCRVTEGPDAAFVGLDRSAFRETYFDENGDLKIEFADELNTSPAFIAAAIDLGFFVYNGDLTGRLRIERDGMP